jgi:hypothetical protein
LQAQPGPGGHPDFPRTFESGSVRESDVNAAIRIARDLALDPGAPAGAIHHIGTEPLKDVRSGLEFVCGALSFITQPLHHGMRDTLGAVEGRRDRKGQLALGTIRIPRVTHILTIAR